MIGGEMPDWNGMAQVETTSSDVDQAAATSSDVEIPWLRKRVSGCTLSQSIRFKNKRFLTLACGGSS